MMKSDYSEYDLIKEKGIFDTLDSMIHHYHKTKKVVRKSMSLYTPFFEIHKYICDLENQGKIITDNPKSIKYLEELLINDGPEYALVINFESKVFPKRKYRIGACVRGEPLLERK